MPRYQSTRHRRMMDLSETALENALASESQRDSRIAATVIGDDQKYRLWEAGHADMLIPISQQSRKKPQILALREAKVQLIHRRAFFRYLRDREVTGERRRVLFRLFHSTLDFNDAVLAEHRQYMLAVSSRISTDYIVDVMQDLNSTRLLNAYERTFARYFEMKCHIACAPNSSTTPLVQEALRDIRSQLLRIRRTIETADPAGNAGNFDYQELLARSGRYPVLNYLNA